MTKLVLALLVVVPACSSNNNKPPDARASTIDGRAAADASMHDATPGSDAAGVASTVNVVANCTGVQAADIAVTIKTDADTFAPSTASIAAGQYVKFTTEDDHNLQSEPGATAANTFSSGAPGSQTVCLQFTVAGTFPFECIVHASMGMTGTLTVK